MKKNKLQQGRLINDNTRDFGACPTEPMFKSMGIPATMFRARITDMIEKDSTTYQTKTETKNL